MCVCVCVCVCVHMSVHMPPFIHTCTVNPNRPSQVILTREISAGLPTKEPIAPASTPGEERGPGRHDRKPLVTVSIMNCMYIHVLKNMYLYMVGLG